jgi:D-3-phosphoglycerate dehydrogenase
VSKPVVLIAEELSPATIDALGPASTSATSTAPTVPRCSRDRRRRRDPHPLGDEGGCRGDRRGIRLKVVARAGVGLDNVDIKAATAAGVMVVNAPTSNIISAAELTVGTS